MKPPKACIARLLCISWFDHPVPKHSKSKEKRHANQETPHSMRRDNKGTKKKGKRAKVQLRAGRKEKYERKVEKILSEGAPLRSSPTRP